MNKLDPKTRAQILTLLCEGMAIRAITRVTGASKNTVAKLLADVGQACAACHDQHVRNLKSQRIQMDEIWSFVYQREARKERADRCWRRLDMDRNRCRQQVAG
jgi:IS30 family transposase